MKRLIAFVLCFSILLTGWSQGIGESETSGKEETSEETLESLIPEFSGLDDEALLPCMEDLIYQETVAALNNPNYLVENVSAVYYSKEYLEEIAYNSKENIYFGYSLAAIDELFEGNRYVFTLGENGATTVQEMQALDDPTFETILKNIAIGSGVILVCVTVSAVTAGAGAPAVSIIFAVAAKTATTTALYSAAFGGVVSGIVTGIQTGDMSTALKAAALTGSESFKWGAISGAISGTVATTAKYAKAMRMLKGAELKGLTVQEAAAIQMESGYPVDVIKEFTSMEQYDICKKAGLTSQMVNGNTALIREIDLSYVDEMGRTNFQRMQQGLAAIDPNTGLSYELHHIGQKTDSTLAILTKAEHMQGGNNKIWHELGKATEVHGAGSTWDSERQAFWQALAKILGGIAK